MKHLRTGLLAAGMALSATTMVATTATAKDLVIGMACDRTGPTQTVGVVLCPAYHDYVKLVNSKGGIIVN